MKENLVATGLAFALLLIAIAARKPTTEASPQQVEGLNPTALDDSAVVTTTATEPAAEQDAVFGNEQATASNPAVYDYAVRFEQPGTKPQDVAGHVWIQGPDGMWGLYKLKPAAAPAIRYAQPQYRHPRQRRGVPIIRRLRGRR